MKRDVTYRQGDVLLRRVGSIPKEATQKDEVLAYGESTGHKHRIVGGLVLLHEGKQYVDVQESAELVHEEHKPISLPRGTYEVVRQREYDLLQGVRQVMD